MFCLEIVCHILVGINCEGKVFEILMTKSDKGDGGSKIVDVWLIFFFFEWPYLGKIRFLR